MTSTRDRYDMPLSTSSAEAAAQYQEGVDRLLSYRYGADQAFAAAVAADAGFALAHAGLALFAQFQGQGKAARAAIEQATTLVGARPGASGSTSGAVGAHGRGDRARPRPRRRALDGVSARRAPRQPGEQHDRLRRPPGPRGVSPAFIERLAPAYGDDWWFQSALPSRITRPRRFDESRRLSERSLEQYPGNASASHNIAHVCFEAVDTDGVLPRAVAGRL